MFFNEYKKMVDSTELDDYSSLLNLGRKWKKIEKKGKILKIAFLGSNSIQLVASVTRALLTKYDIYADLYEGEYNGILMDVMDMESPLYKFAPEYIVILPDFRDIADQKPRMLANKEEVLGIVERTVKNYLSIFESVHSKLPGSQIIFSNFVLPFYGPLGNLEANYLFSQKSFFELINWTLLEKRPSYVTIVDMEGLSNYVGKGKWFDESAYFLSKSGFALPYIGLVSDLLARQFEGFMGRPRKCLVLDLDNTVWGGAVGDLGCNGINIDPNDAEGEAYLQFQKYVLELKNRGIILAVCSKNEEVNAKEPFEKNPFMILRLTDISAFAANWNDKVSNIRSLASELNIGTDSMVFFDDNPTERALVKEYLPEVRVIDVPEDPALYVRALDRAFAFEWNQITPEDLSRSQSYANNQERSSIMASCVDYEDYLRKLHMRISFKAVQNDTAERFVQLTNKSNQFNVRTQRYTEAEIEQMKSNPSYGLFTVSMEDRFSKYGVIACVVLRFADKTCFIENWVMSCRVLKKSVENYTIERIVEVARAQNCSEIKACYEPTKKNGMVRDLYDQFGFSLVSNKNEVKLYSLNKQQMESFSQVYYFEEDLQSESY